MKPDATKPAKKKARQKLPTEASYLIADARNDITIPYFTDVLQPLDDTLIQRGGGKGLKIYDEIERDTHAGSMLQKRKRAVLSREWEIKPASPATLDVKAADFCREVIANMAFDGICEDLLDATLKGFAISEIVWRQEGAQIIPDQIVAHDQRRFVFDEGWNPRLLTWANMRAGMELPTRKFMVHRFGVKGNNPYGLGLGSRLFWPVLFKREGVAFWLHFLEKFASPTVVGHTPYTSLPGEERKLLNILVSLRGRSAITVPVGADVKFLEASRSGSVTYQDFLTYWDKQISICVNGETLTTDIGSSGSRAAAETHAEQLDMGADSDSDLLSGTLRDSLLTWLVEYNYPGAGVPWIWRIRQKNEKQAAETRRAKAEAARATNDALIKLLITSAEFDDDGAARDYITSFDLTDNLSDDTIDSLIAARFSFVDASQRGRNLRQLTKTNPAFAALFADQGKKKAHDQLSGRDDVVEALTRQLEDAAQEHFGQRIGAIRNAFETGTDWQAVSHALLELAANWSPDRLAAVIGDALETGVWEGREAVYLDGETATEFAEGKTIQRQPFREQIAFLRQKRPAPTKRWTDALRGVHDRKFVVAGATDLDMVSDFQNVIAKASEDGTSLDDFRKEFDRIVAQYGWSYKGKYGWRIRVIFETNMRTSYMAGRLKQMRDPDVIRLRPFWQYRHGETRIPITPRQVHLAWDGLVLRHDDPWWDKHFPPNDWLCSCGVATLSQANLKRMNKDGPDKAPDDLYEPVVDPVTGKLTEKPQGVGYGWDYQPGNLWEQGLVPSALMDEGTTLAHPRMGVSIDEPEPIADLLARAKPFAAKPLPEGLPPEDYVTAFLDAFGAGMGEAVLWEDKAGNRMPISDQLFRDRAGELKIMKHDRAVLAPLLAEALIDPDEIWIGVARKADPVDRGIEDLVVDRRYIRADPSNGLLIVFEIGQRFWEAITAFNTTTKSGKPDLKTLDRRRGGKLLYKRK